MSTASDRPNRWASSRVPSEFAKTVLLASNARPYASSTSRQIDSKPWCTVQSSNRSKTTVRSPRNGFLSVGAAAVKGFHVTAGVLPNAETLGYARADLTHHRL